MDPATLYILYKLADGTEKVRERRFETVSACEAYVKKAFPPRPEVQLVHYRCANLFKMEGAPDWYTQHGAVKVINDDSLDPKYRP